jgi:hypothetical protein
MWNFINKQAIFVAAYLTVDMATVAIIALVSALLFII